MDGLLPELEVIRKDFPILSRALAGGLPLVYLDSANTSQKPQVVIDTMVDHLERHNANIARAMHQLGAESTEAFEGGRDKVAAFINAPDRDEVIFTKNATEALNLAANTLAWPGTVRSAPATRSSSPRWSTTPTSCRGSCSASAPARRCAGSGSPTTAGSTCRNIDELITERTKVVSFTWVSNMLGTINPVAEIARRAHEVGALVVVDASQAAPQLPVDLAAMADDERPDLLAFTGHKVVGPTGIGVLWGRREVLDQLPPFLGGGEMIETVTMERSTYAPVPAQVRGRHAADRRGGRPRRRGRLPRPPRHGRRPRARAGDHGVRPRGAGHRPRPDRARPARRRRSAGERSPSSSPACTRTTSRTVLDTRGIAVRAGHHCAKPAHARFGVQSSTRMSSYLYTTPAEIDALVEGLEYTRSLLQVELNDMSTELDSLYQEIILDHYQQPPPQGAARAVRGRGAPRQPDLR